MNSLKPREKIILAAVIAVFLFFTAWRMGLEEVFDNLGKGGSSDVSSLEKKFYGNLEKIGQMYQIEREFRRVGEFPASSDEKLRPALAFTQQVSDMCRNMGFEFPPIRPQAMPIDGVDDYEMINVTIKTEGTFENTVRLFKEFENKGLIFRQVDLRAIRDRDVLVATVTVARIAPVEKRNQRPKKGPTRS